MSVSTAHHSSHRRTSIPVTRRTFRHPSPPPPRVSSRTAKPRNYNEPSTSSGNYTLSWQPDREEEYIAVYGYHEHRRPRSRTVAASPEVDAARSTKARPRSTPNSTLDLCPPSASRTWLAASQSRKERRKAQRRPPGVTRRDSGYESDDADEDTSNEDTIHYTPSGRSDTFAPHHKSSAAWPSQVSPLPRPESPSNESSASTDDDYDTGEPANVDPFALEYYLGNDDTWRDAEVLSHSSDSDSDDERPMNLDFGPHSSHLYSEMGVYSYMHTSTRRSHHNLRRPRIPKRLPLVPTCSKSRKRASMRAAWRMRFGRLFESDSEAPTEIEDELDWEGYESADARRIIADRIRKAGGGDGRKVMEGGAHLAELLVKNPVDSRRLARRVPRKRTRADTARPDSQLETEVDACPTCTSIKSPRTITTSPSSTEFTSLPTPTSTPPTSAPNTPCPSCANFSPREDSAGLPSPPSSRKALSPRSPPCKTTPLNAGTDPLTVFAVAAEREKQHELSGLLAKPAPSATSSMLSGLVRGVKSWFGRINNLVDIAASTPLRSGAVDGACSLSPVMGGSIARGETRRPRAASAPVAPTSPTPTRVSRRRRSLVKSLPGAPTSPYGYRVRPQQVSAAFPAWADERVEELNVAATHATTVELDDVLSHVRKEDSSPTPSPIELKAPPEPGKRRRASRSRSPSRRKKERKEKERAVMSAAELEAELTRPRAVVDSKYWRVLAGEMEQRRLGGVEVAFMVRLAVEEGRNLPIFTSEARQARTGEIVVGGVWKASLARCRLGGVGKGQTRIRSGLIHEVWNANGDGSDVFSDSSSAM